jgi:hypothetical protein
MAINVQRKKPMNPISEQVSKHNEQSLAEWEKLEEAKMKAKPSITSLKRSVTEAALVKDVSDEPPKKKPCLPSFSLLYTGDSTNPNQTPQQDEVQRELTPDEKATFHALGYDGEIFAFKSQSMANFGKWFVGKAKNDFGCWLDKPIKNGFIQKADGQIVSKDQLNRPYYKPWAQDPNTNFFAWLSKQTQTNAEFCAGLNEFLLSMQARLEPLEEWYQHCNGKETQQDGGEITEY